MTSSPDVLIIGAGLAGLSCARLLQENDVHFQILEASDGVGGRIRTDHVDGFLLDRGFQVFLTAYPEAQRVLNYPLLDLKTFSHGALSWFAGRMNKLVDPWRTAGAWMETLQSDLLPSATNSASPVSVAAFGTPRSNNSFAVPTVPPSLPCNPRASPRK